MKTTAIHTLQRKKGLCGLHPIVMLSCINFRAKIKVLINTFTSFLLLTIKKAPGSKLKQSVCDKLCFPASYYTTQTVITATEA